MSKGPGGWKPPNIGGPWPLCAVGDSAGRQELVTNMTGEGLDYGGHCMCVRKQNCRSKPLRSFAWKNVRLGLTF